MVTLSTLIASLSNPLVAAEPLSVRSEFAQRLTKRHSGIVDGQPLRVAISIVATPKSGPADHINVWVDRNVNPDIPVSPGSLGPTRYASLIKIADRAGCVCYPIQNCVLIGRPIWVADLAQKLLSDSPWSYRKDLQSGNESNLRGDRRSGDRNSTRSKVDIRWQNLTTPAEALRIVAGHSENMAELRDLADQLPHDLWPAADLRDVTAGLASQLILGQFLGEIDSAVITTPFSRSYRFPDADDAADVIRRIDPYARMKFSSGVFELTGTPAAHQLFCNTMFSGADDVAPTQDSPKSDDLLEQLRNNKRTFSLTVDEKPAGALIKALIGQLGFDCEFADKANPRLQKLVSLSAKDQTVWELVRLISGQASLKIEGSGDKLLISAKDDG